MNIFMLFKRLYQIIFIIVNLKSKYGFNKNPKKIKSPGQLKLHYSPGIPILMNKKYPKKDEAFITFGKKFKDDKNHYNLSKNDKNIINEITILSNLNILFKFIISVNSKNISSFKEGIFQC